MISTALTVLDQAQKLVGRGLLIAAFVPTMIAVAASASLLLGPSAFAKLVNAWAQQPARAVFQIASALVGVYLLAYVLYGMRSWINMLYQGSLPRPLKRVLRWNQNRVMRRYRGERHKADAAVTDAMWPTDGFEPTWVQLQLSDRKASRLLEKATVAHDGLMSTLRRRRIDSDDYRRLLERARALQCRAVSEATPPPGAIDKLVAAMKQEYRDHEEFQVAAVEIRDRALRDWTLAQREFDANFPESARWLRATRLGNQLGALDYAVLKRYGITLGDLWPRLQHVITDDVRRRVEDANLYLDFTLMMSLLSATTTVVALAAVAVGPARRGTVQVTLVVLSLLAWWLFYRLAMVAARNFAEHVRAAVDLFRLKLLDALSIERPRVPADEQLTWDEMEKFIAQGDIPGRHVRFAGAAAPAVQPPGLLDVLATWWRQRRQQ